MPKAWTRAAIALPPSTSAASKASTATPLPCAPSTAARCEGVVSLRDPPKPRQHYLMPSPIGDTPKGAPRRGSGFQVRAPLPESAPDVAGIELERIADGDEREGAIHVAGREPGLDLREQTPRSRASASSPPVERHHGIR